MSLTLTAKLYEILSLIQANTTPCAELSYYLDTDGLRDGYLSDTVIRALKFQMISYVRASSILTALGWAKARLMTVIMEAVEARDGFLAPMIGYEMIQSSPVWWILRNKRGAASA